MQATKNGDRGGQFPTAPDFSLGSPMTPQVPLAGARNLGQEMHQKSSRSTEIHLDLGLKT